MNTLRKYPLIFPISISLFLLFLILLLPKFLPPKLPLFYSLPWGDKQLGSINQFLIIPAVILIINLVNLLIIRQLHPQQVLFKTILFFASIFLSLILLITVLRVVMIFL